MDHRARDFDLDYVPNATISQYIRSDVLGNSFWFASTGSDWRGEPVAYDPLWTTGLAISISIMCLTPQFHSTSDRMYWVIPFGLLPLAVTGGVNLWHMTRYGPPGSRFRSRLCA